MSANRLLIYALTLLALTGLALGAHVWSNSAQAGTPITSSPSGEIALEVDGAHELTLSLGARPSGDVTVVLVSTDPAVVGLSAGDGESAARVVLNFSEADWQTAQTVTLTGLAPGLATIARQVSGGGGPPSYHVQRVQVGAASYSEITISGSSGVTEGGTATFTISASPAPASPIIVNIGVSETGSWSASGAATVSVSGASTPYTITTADDQVDEADGSVTATVQSGAGYTVGTAASATVSVADDDATVDRFMVTRKTGNSLTVQWPVAPNADGYLVTWQRVSDSGGYGESRTTETYYKITGLLPETEYTITLLSTRGGSLRFDWFPVPLRETTPVVIPEVSVAAGADINEGEDAIFTISAQPAPVAPLTVQLTVAEDGSYAASGAVGERTVTIPTSGSATYRVSTVDDEESEASGSVTVTLKPGDAYVVAEAPDDSGQVAVADDDTPVVSISGGSGVTEGDNAVFQIRVNPPTAVMVMLLLHPAPNFVSRSGIQRVDVPASGSFTYTVPTDDDQLDEPDGEVGVIILENAGYAVAEGSGRLAKVTVSDNDLPVVSVDAGSVDRDSGTADFTVSVNPPASAPLTVALDVSQVGDLVAASSLGRQTVAVPAGGVVDHTVTIATDRTPRAEDSVTATLAPGTTYTIAPPPGDAATASLAGDSNQWPVISLAHGITDDGWGMVSEGDALKFTVVANPPPKAPLAVTLLFSQESLSQKSGCRLGCRL